MMCFSSNSLFSPPRLPPPARVVLGRMVLGVKTVDELLNKLQGTGEQVCEAPNTQHSAYSVVCA